jgi:uncharacterized protein
MSLHSPKTSIARLVVALLLVAPVVVRAAFPKPIGYVNDFAALLDAGARAELDVLLRETEQATTAEIAIATVTSLDGLTVEDYANQLFQEWGIGKKASDNGVLVLVAPNEREMRIEVGYGLEPVLPDGLAGEIIRTEFLPEFKSGNYGAGILAGVRRVAGIVRRNQPVTADQLRQLQDSSSDEIPPWLIVPFLSTFVALGTFGVGVGLRTKTFFPLIWGGLFGGVPLVLVLTLASLASILFVGPLAVAMLAWGFAKGKSPSWSRALRGKGAGAGSTGWVMGSDSSGSGSSGSGSSSSSFGGGSSGGGGASGRW